MAFVDDTTGGRVILEGIGPIKITLAGTVEMGDPVGYSSGWKVCDADTSPNYAEFVAGGPGVSGDIITAYREALIDFGSGSTATENDILYISTTAGSYSSSVNDTNGRNHQVGFMTSIREGWLQPTAHFFTAHYNRTTNETSSDVNGFELRLENSVTTTGEVKAFSASARLSSAAAGNTLAAAKFDINLKGTAAGTLSSDVRVIQLEAESASGGTRTITGCVAFIWCKNNMGTGTYSDKFCVIHVTNQGGGKAMDGFLQVNATGNAGVVISNDAMTSDPSTNNEAGYLKVYVGTTEYQIPMYAA